MKVEMYKVKIILLFFAFLLLVKVEIFTQTKVNSSEITAKPWTYWWWMGSSVTKAGITSNLTKMSNAGLGGVHIVPIYGEKGDEDNYIPYLSDEWMEMLNHTVCEANRLRMGVDMTSGTGWPFGGPEIDLQEAAKFSEISTMLLDSMSFSSFKASALTPNTVGYALYDSKDRCIYAEHSTKTPPASIFSKAKKVVLIRYRPTRQKVKRAAPGGEGFVIDVFSESVMQHYMTKFQQVFAQTNYTGKKPRAFYNDSYEVGGANFTVDFLTEFQRRRGYDLLPHLHTLADTIQTKKRVRLVTDYCETISDLLLDWFTRTWVNISHDMGFITRNQAHGSPANLLDLYAAADIPETESFGASSFNIPGLVTDADYDENHFGRPDPLIMKLASSAAHIKGKPLVSSETATWLADHFKVSLAQVKPQVDELFVAGINHIFYHGTTYSPPEKEFPGRLFYASTNFGPLSHFWNEFPLLNQYITDCQTILQHTTPDNDILLYFGIHDIWSKLNSKRYIRTFNVHHADSWFFTQSTGMMAKKLWNKGYAFDYVSDLGLLNDVTLDADGIKSGSNKYKAIVVPALAMMPIETLKQLLVLAKQGVNVYFESDIPQDVPGYFQFEKRKKEIKRLKANLLKLPNVKINKDICVSLQMDGFPREKMSDVDLNYIRKKSGDTLVYFISNLSNRFEEGWVELAKGAKHIEIYDVKSQVRGKALQDDGKVFVQLKPGNSCFLFCADEKLTEKPYPYIQKMNNEIDLSYGWNLKTIQGFPDFPPEINVDTLRCWTSYGESFKHFSGTINYSKVFELPEDMLQQEDWQLEIAEIKETAEIILNGVPVGTIWSLPNTILIPGKLLGKHNKIELKVTNTSFNRVIELDQQNVLWKNFHEINFVNIRYEPYDASQEQPIASGLIGKVSLIPCELGTIE